MKRILPAALGLWLFVSALNALAAPAPAKPKSPSSKPAASKVLRRALDVRGIELVRGGRPFPLRAVEFPGLRDLSPEMAEDFLKLAKAAGAQAVMVQVLTLSSASRTGLLGPDGNINDTEWASLDSLLAAARRENMGLLLTLSAGESPRGGQAQWAAWVGSSNPGVFFRDFRIQKWFQDAEKSLLARVNPQTHTAYGNDPSLWALVLADSPLNPGGDEAGFNHWVADNAALIHRLAPKSCVALALSPTASDGLDPAVASGVAGVDFVVLRLPKGSGGRPAADWALQTGRPVVAFFSTEPPGLLSAGVAGALVGLDGIPENFREAQMRKSLAALGDSAPRMAGLFKTMDVAAVGVPELKDGASARVSVALGEPAKLVLRWGQGSTMDGRLEGPQASRNDFRLDGLTADQDLSVQVEARKADGTVVLSDRRTLHLPPVAPMKLNFPPESRNFITVRGDHFYDGDKPWRYVGTNNYYLNQIDAKTRDSILADTKALGMKVIRVWAFGEGHPNMQAWEKPRFFTLSPGKYDEDNLRHLDELVASAGKHGLRLICALANNWADYGGAPQWAAYFGYKDKDDFFDKSEVQKAFRDYVRMLLTRVNTVTGVAYKDDPTIFAWDLMNEPQYKRDQSGKVMAQWVADMSAFVKGLGAKQLVTTGLEGHRAQQGNHYSGTDFIGSQSCPTIDFATYHIYPASEYSRWNLSTTEAVIEGYVKDGHEILKKPVVMEEFGIPKTDPKYDKPLWVRDMMKTFFKAGGDGLNYWMIVDPDYRYGDGNEFDRTMTETANTFSVTARELEAGK